MSFNATWDDMLDFLKKSKLQMLNFFKFYIIER